MKLSSPVAVAFSIISFTAFAVFGFSNVARAFRISGSSTGTWGKPIPQTRQEAIQNGRSVNTNPFHTGVGESKFTWGQTGVFNTPPNSLDFTGNNSFSTKTNSLFKIGELTYFNGTTPLGTNVDEARLNLDISFTNPVKTTEKFDFSFSLKNTPNLGTPEENADYVLIRQNVAQQIFQVNGRTFALSLTGFIPEGSNKKVNEFRSLEETTTKAEIYGTITSVPEPTTFAGLSILGVYLVSRRKSRK